MERKSSNQPESETERDRNRWWRVRQAEEFFAQVFQRMRRPYAEAELPAIPTDTSHDEDAQAETDLPGNPSSPESRRLVRYPDDPEEWQRLWEESNSRKDLPTVMPRQPRTQPRDPSEPDLFFDPNDGWIKEQMPDGIVLPIHQGPTQVWN